MILADVAHGRQRHVPYRDSRLTFLLQVGTYFPWSSGSGSIPSFSPS